MATVNYTETELDKKRKLVKWTSLAAGDTGQPFDMAGFSFKTLHIYPDATTNLVLDILLSNETGAPNAANSPSGFQSSSAVPQLIPAFYDLRWIWPKISSGSTGGWNVILYVQEQ